MKEADDKKHPSPFDYSKSILNSHNSIPMSEGYVPFIVNRALAHHRDCIYICQMLNEFQVTPEQHYTFLFNQVPKHKRTFERWVSAKNSIENTSDLELISKYYQCSMDVARQYLEIYPQEAIGVLRSAYGGKEPGKASTTDTSETEGS